MTQASPILALPYLMPSQAQKHVTHNTALQMLDALGAGPGGAWAGQGHAIAAWQGEGWLFLAPAPGCRAWGITEAELRVWDGSAWVLPPTETQNLARLGVGTTADATNPLSVSGPATLLSHAGSGHQLKINKSASAETASLLFQSNWSSRAEMGLAGSNDFSVKLSANGSSHDYLLAGGSPDFRLGSDGNGSYSGAWTGGGADYAEWFEWKDGTPQGKTAAGPPWCWKA